MCAMTGTHTDCVWNVIDGACVALYMWCQARMSRWMEVHMARFLITMRHTDGTTIETVGHGATTADAVAFARAYEAEGWTVVDVVTQG